VVSWSLLCLLSHAPMDPVSTLFQSELKCPIDDYKSGCQDGLNHGTKQSFYFKGLPRVPLPIYI